MARKPSSVISLTWRYRRNGYSGGGPASVLLTSELLLGHQLDDMELMYEFQPRGFEMNRAAVELVRQTTNDPFLSVYYWAANLARYWGSSAFVAHDPITAAGLALAKAPYILVYHSQGSLVYEMEQQRGPIGSSQKEALLRAETLAFNGAQNVYFPSIGARQAFEETRTSETASASYAESPLYNTTSPLTLEATSNDYDPVRGFTFKRVNFISVGGVTFSKGLDALPAYLAEYKRRAGADFKWFIFTNNQNVRLTELKEVIESYELSSFVSIVDVPVPRAVLHSVMSQCQYYLMAHRHSIFDLATLEAMRLGLVPILSPIGGNLEVNVSNNVQYLTSVESILEAVEGKDWLELSARNRHAYEVNFGREAFCNAYFAAMRALMLR